MPNVACPNPFARALRARELKEAEETKKRIELQNREAEAEKRIKELAAEAGLKTEYFEVIIDRDNTFFVIDTINGGFLPPPSQWRYFTRARHAVPLYIDLPHNILTMSGVCHPEPLTPVANGIRLAPNECKCHSWQEILEAIEAGSIR